MDSTGMETSQFLPSMFITDSYIFGAGCPTCWDERSVATYATIQDDEKRRLLKTVTPFATGKIDMMSQLHVFTMQTFTSLFIYVVT